MYLTNTINKYPHRSTETISKYFSVFLKNASLIAGEQCSATCEVSSLLFSCPYTCGSVTTACVAEDGAAPATPEDAIAAAADTIAAAEEDIKVEADRSEDAQSFGDLIEILDSQLDRGFLFSPRKKPSAIIKCSDFESGYTEFLDLLAVLSDDNLANAKEYKLVLLESVLSLNRICTKAQRESIKIKVKTKKDKAKIEITVYKKKKDDKIKDLVKIIEEALEAIQEANDQLSAEGKPTVAPPAPSLPTTAAPVDTSTTSAAAGATTTSAGATTIAAGATTTTAGATTTTAAATTTAATTTTAAATTTAATTTNAPTTTANSG